MCNLCNINHHIEDEEYDDYDDEPSLCVHQANHVHHLQQDDMAHQKFEPVKAVLSGSSF